MVTATIRLVNVTFSAPAAMQCLQVLQRTCRLCLLLHSCDVSESDVSEFGAGQESYLRSKPKPKPSAAAPSSSSPPPTASSSRPAAVMKAPEADSCH